MESHDIVRDEKLIESDEILNKDVEMKCEIDKKEDQKEKQLLQKQQQEEEEEEEDEDEVEEEEEEYNCHNDEIQEPEELIESEIATLLARNHQINILQNEQLKQSSINNVNNDNRELSNESHELKHVVAEEQENEQINNDEELSDNNTMKQENIVNSDINEGDDRDDDREEEKEEDNDKNLEKEKSTQGQDVSEDNPHFDRLSLMGRNRRVRQKNRYFLDFHCVDLTKGARSNKDDYDGFTTTTTTSTRSSNRRSTTDSNRGQQDETDGIESRYCRKCSAKTMHDVDGGCQPCLYKKIVESSKRQRPGGQRGRSNNSRQHHQQNDNENELSSNTTTNKRKATRQGGGSKINGNNSSNINTSSNNNNNINTTTTTITAAAATTTTNTTSVTEDTTSVNNDNIVSITTDESGIDKLPKLDSWTPDEVAEFILSKGFTQEAELFKMQSVDGISLLLMQRTDFTYGLKIKLGPALKIYDQVCKLKKEYFRSVATTN